MSLLFSDDKFQLRCPEGHSPSNSTSWRIVLSSLNSFHRWTRGNERHPGRRLAVTSRAVAAAAVRMMMTMMKVNIFKQSAYNYIHYKEQIRIGLYFEILFKILRNFLIISLLTGNISYDHKNNIQKTGKIEANSCSLFLRSLSILYWNSSEDGRGDL